MTEEDDILSSLKSECFKVLLWESVPIEKLPKAVDIFFLKELITRVHRKKFFEKFEEGEREKAYESLFTAFKDEETLTKRNIESALGYNGFPIDELDNLLISHVISTNDSDDFLLLVQNWNEFTELEDKLKPLALQKSKSDNWVRTLVHEAFNEILADNNEKVIFQALKNELMEKAIVEPVSEEKLYSTESDVQLINYGKPASASDALDGPVNENSDELRSKADTQKLSASKNETSSIKSRSGDNLLPSKPKIADDRAEPPLSNSSHVESPQQATTIIQKQTVIAMNYADHGSQIESSDTNNSNIMNLTFPQSGMEQGSSIEDILRTINESTIRSTAHEITKNRNLSEPKFQVHSQMREARDFYDGQYLSTEKKVVKTETKKMLFGLIRRTVKKIQQNQFIKDNYFNMSYDEEESEEVTMESLTEMIMKKQILRTDQSLDVICLTASAGYGKTTCMRRLERRILGLCGITEKNNFISSQDGRFDMVISLDCKDIVYEQSTTLSKFLFGDYFSDAYDESHAYNWVLKNQSRAVLFLDGFDQLTKKVDKSSAVKMKAFGRASTDTIIYNLLARNLLPHLQIVISSREFSVASLPEKSWPGRMITLNGLKEDDVEKLFIALLGGNGEKAWDKVKLASGLLRNLIQIPVYLIFTAVIMARDLGAHPPDSATELIRRIFEMLPNSSNILHDDIAAIIERLKILAHEGMVEGRVVFSHRDLERQGLTKEQVRDIMIQIPGNPILNQRFLEGDFVFYFCHQSLQEYLSAKYISEMEMKKFKDFRSKHLFDSRWSFVIQFVCGILYEEDETLITDRKKKQKILYQILQFKLKNAQKQYLDYQKLEIYASLRETRNRSLVDKLMTEIEISASSLSRYGIHLIAWIMTCKGINKVGFFRCGIDDDFISVLTEELRRMENKPYVEHLEINDGERFLFTMDSLKLLLKHLVAEKLKFWDAERKLKYCIFDWDNIYRMDVCFGRVIYDHRDFFTFIEDQLSIQINSDVECEVTINGVFHKQTKLLQLKCDAEKSKHSEYFACLIGSLEMFFEPREVACLLKGRYPQQLMKYEDFEKMDRKIDGEISDILLDCSGTKMEDIVLSDLTSFASQFKTQAIDVAADCHVGSFDDNDSVSFDSSSEIGEYPIIPIAKKEEIIDCLSKSDIKCTMYLCATIYDRNQLMNAFSAMKDDVAVDMKLYIQYKAQVKDLKQLVQKFKSRRLIIVNDGSSGEWKPSRTNKQDILETAARNMCTVEIVDFKDLSGAWQLFFT